MDTEIMLDMAREREAVAYRTPKAKGRGANSDAPDVAGNLRRLRKERGLSLETLAKRSGVSRAMLGQIETGRSVPTVTLVWKVSKALGVALSDLIETPVQGQFSLLARSKIRMIAAPEGGVQQFAFTTPELQTPYEFSEIRIASGHAENFAARAPGTRATCGVEPMLMDSRS
jgi:transcriptional regulator with XRE-family HTH domain